MVMYLVIRRKKTTIYLDVKDCTTVYEVKKIVEAITKVPPENQELYKDDLVMENLKALEDYGFERDTAPDFIVGQIGLAYKDNDTLEFESLEITPYSIPPELPDVLKSTLENKEARIS